MESATPQLDVVLYHGAREPRRAAALRARGFQRRTLGIWLTADYDEALGYNTDDDPRAVVRARVRLRRPLVIEGRWPVSSVAERDALIRAACVDGHDGIVVSPYGHRWVVAIDPECVEPLALEMAPRLSALDESPRSAEPSPAPGGDNRQQHLS